MMAADPGREFVVFSLHDERYAVPVAAVRELVRYAEPSAKGAASGSIRGLISLRGRVLPVVDLSARLGHELRVSDRTRILVLEQADGAVGLIVDAVDGVQSIRADQIEPLPASVAGGALGEEIAVVGERLVILIDPAQLLGDRLAQPPPGKLPNRPRLSSFLRPRDLE